jgi:hypothetical protein
MIEKYPISERVMFGCYYIMIIHDYNLGGLKNYYDNFKPFEQKVHYDNENHFFWETDFYVRQLTKGF